MLRTLGRTAGLMLLAGCAGAPLDPYSGIDTRLRAMELATEAEFMSATDSASPLVGDVIPCRQRRTETRRPDETRHPQEVALLSTHLAPAQLTSDLWEVEAAPGASERSASGRRAPLPGLWDTIERDVRSMPADLWSDTKAVYGSAPNLLILGLTYGGALAVQKTGPDDTVEDSYRHHTTFSKDARDIFGMAGNPGTHFALAGAWYLLGQQTQDERTYEVGRTLFSALIINGLSTLAGQAASWDRSPNGELGTFPSGHTSSTFTFASVMHEVYGPLVGAPLYGLGVLVAIERLEDDEHYLSDVIMGGVMGLVIGHTVAGEHEFKLFGGEILPYADPNTGSSGIAWVKHFK